MLKLHGSNLSIGDDLMIYPDDDPKSNVFYYISQKPRLVFNSDGKPVLDVYAVIPESGKSDNLDSILESGLSLDVDLGVTEEQLTEARKAIVDYYYKGNKEETKIILSPVTLQEGKVYFTMARAGGTPEKKWFISSGNSPSMIGSNRATLGVRVTGEDAKSMIASLTDGAEIGTIIYDLKLVGITPVYKAKLHANMQLVYHHLQEKTKKNYIFKRESIENLVEELQQTNALTIEVEELDPEIKAEAMKSLFDELKSEVIKSFFTDVSLISGKVTISSVVEGISDLVGGLLDVVIPGKSYIRKEVNESQLREITIDLHQKSAKTQPIAPQGNISEIISQNGVNVKDYIRWVRLDELEFKGQPVEIQLSADSLETEFISAVSVICEVLDADTGELVIQQTLVFDGLISEEESSSSSKKKSKVLSQKFRYTRFKNKNYRIRYKADFHFNQKRAEWGLKANLLSTGWVETDNNYIFINPADYYHNAELNLMAPDNTVFDKANKIHVYVDVMSGNELLKTDFRELSKNHDTCNPIKAIASTAKELTYRIKVIFYRSGDDDLTITYDGPVEGGHYPIPNPYEYKWTVELDCIADWNRIKRVAFTAHINDVAQPTPWRYNFTESKTNTNLETNCSTSKVDFDYSFKVYLRDGGEFLESPVFTLKDDDYLEIDADSLKAERHVKVKVKNPDDFAKKGIAVIDVTLTPPGETMQIFKKDGEVKFVYPWKSNESKTYTYSFVAKDSRGRILYRSNQMKDDSDELLLEFS